MNEEVPERQKGPGAPADMTDGARRWRDKTVEDAETEAMYVEWEYLEGKETDGTLTPEEADRLEEIRNKDNPYR